MDDQLQELESIQSNLDEQAFLAGLDAELSHPVISSILADREVESRQVEADVLSQATDDSMEDDRNIVGERLEMVRGEEDALKNALARALQVQESTLKDLARKQKELSALEVRVQELENGIIEARENLREKALDSVRLEKAFMEIRLDEVKAKNEASAANVSGLEAERQSLVENNQRLEAEADGLKASILSMKKEERELRNEIAEMEKKNVKIAEELQSEVAKKEAAVKKVSSLESEVRNLSEGSRGLEADLNNSNSTVESLKKERERLQSQVAEMEKVDDEISRKLKKRKNEVEQVQQLQRALSDFARKEEEWKAQSDAWKVEKTRFEQRLMTARRSLFDMENKFERAKIKSLRALALLKNTREMMTGVARGNANVVERNIGSGEDQNNEEMEPFVEELDTIATVFNQTVGKIEDMNRELRDLQEALAKAQRRRRSLMSRLFAFTLAPASTTLVVAISIVYMAKRR